MIQVKTKSLTARNEWTNVSGETCLVLEIYFVFSFLKSSALLAKSLVTLHPLKDFQPSRCPLSSLSPF